MWALGVCLYYVVYAKLPFTGFNTMELYRNIMHSEPDFDDHEHPISDSLKHLLRRLLQKDPSLRATLPEVMSHPWVLRTASSRGREFVPDEEWEAGVAMEASATPQVVQITQLEMDQAVRMDASGSMASIMDTSEAPRVTFKAGECVFAQNEVADVAYFIESGECSVVLAGAHSERLTTLARSDARCPCLPCGSTVATTASPARAATPMWAAVAPARRRFLTCQQESGWVQLTCERIRSMGGSFAWM